MEWTRYELSTLRGARDNSFVGEKVERKGVESPHLVSSTFVIKALWRRSDDEKRSVKARVLLQEAGSIKYRGN